MKINQNILICAFIVVFALIYIKYCEKQDSKLPSKPTPIPIINNKKNVYAAIKRYAVYDPHYDEYSVPECYLGTHHNGEIIRVRGNENWNSAKFVFEPALSPAEGLFYIRSSLGFYLYVDSNFDIASDPMKSHASKYFWVIKTNNYGIVTIKNVVTDRYLALSCNDDNAYSRVNYGADTAFTLEIVR